MKPLSEKEIEKIEAVLGVRHEEAYSIFNQNEARASDIAEVILRERGEPTHTVEDQVLNLILTTAAISAYAAYRLGKSNKRNVVFQYDQIKDTNIFGRHRGNQIIHDIEERVDDQLAFLLGRDRGRSVS